MSASGKYTTPQPSETAEQVKRHYAGAASSYSAEYQEGYAGYPANRKRLELLLKRLRTVSSRTLLDCGCGEGTPMRRIHELGLEVWGFDAVPEMIAQAKKRLGEIGLADRVWVGDLLDPESLQPRQGGIPTAFDVTIAMGVFPHLEDEATAMDQMAGVTRPGGRVFVEFRNELFALFTLNRYSFELFRDKLIQASRLETQYPEYLGDVRRVLKQLQQWFRMDLPPVRSGSAEVPGYDEVLSRFHNPFEVDRLFQGAGLEVVQKYFYHFHAFPPMYGRACPELFRSASLQREEDPTDWRGYVMASAFVVEAVKPERR